MDTGEASAAATHAPTTEETAARAAAAGWSLVAVVVLWGLGPPITKLISAPPLVGASLRLWVSTPVMWLAAGLLGRPISPYVLRRTAVAGVLLAANQGLIFAALGSTSVAVVSVILALQPGVVLFVSGPLLGERPSTWHIAWTGVGIGGVALVILGGEPEVSGSVLGTVLALGAMLSFTGYYVITRLVRTRTPIDSVQWMAGTTSFAALAITPVAVLTSGVDDYRQIDGADWLYVGFVAIAVGLIGHTAMSWTHRYVSASRSSLYLLAMHVVAIGAAWPINGEPVTGPQVLGGAIVLGAVGAVVSRPPRPSARDRPGSAGPP